MSTQEIIEAFKRAHVEFLELSLEYSRVKFEELKSEKDN